MNPEALPPSPDVPPADDTLPPQPHDSNEYPSHEHPAHEHSHEHPAHEHPGLSDEYKTRFMEKIARIQELVRKYLEQATHPGGTDVSEITATIVALRHTMEEFELGMDRVYHERDFLAHPDKAWRKPHVFVRIYLYTMYLKYAVLHRGVPIDGLTAGEKIKLMKRDYHDDMATQLDRAAWWMVVHMPNIEYWHGIGDEVYMTMGLAIRDYHQKQQAASVLLEILQDVAEVS